MVMVQAILFGAGTIAILLTPLRDQAFVYMPVMVVATMLIAAVISWEIAPRLQARYWHKRGVDHDIISGWPRLVISMPRVLARWLRFQVNRRDAPAQGFQRITGAVRGFLVAGFLDLFEGPGEILQGSLGVGIGWTCHRWLVRIEFYLVRPLSFAHERNASMAQ
jgi:hypothetical protein